MTDKTDSYLKDYLSGVRDERVPQDSLDRIKGFFSQGPGGTCPHCGKKISPFKKPLKRQGFSIFLWFTAAAVCFFMSFVMRQYFFQWLVLTVLFGVKGIVEGRAMKTQILIYKAMQEDGATRQQDLHRTPSRL